MPILLSPAASLRTKLCARQAILKLHFPKVPSPCLLLEHFVRLTNFVSVATVEFNKLQWIYRPSRPHNYSICDSEQPFVMCVQKQIESFNTFRVSTHSILYLKTQVWRRWKKRHQIINFHHLLFPTPPQGDRQSFCEVSSDLLCLYKNWRERYLQESWVRDGSVKRREDGFFTTKKRGLGVGCAYARISETPDGSVQGMEREWHGETE